MADGAEGSVAIIADDHELFRAALAEILKKEVGFDSVVEAASLDEVVDVLGRNPGVTLVSVDLGMPGMAGAASMHGVREVYPAVRLVVVSGSERREDILAALAAGVHGYIPKTLRFAQIAAALHTVMDGGIFVPASLSTTRHPRVEPLPEKISEPARKTPVLSTRQTAVLKLMAEGKSNKEIARELKLAEGTVKVHVNALYRALGAHNRVTAVSAMARCI